MVFAQLQGLVVFQCPVCQTTIRAQIHPADPLVICGNCQARIMTGLALWKVGTGHKVAPPDQIVLECGTWRSAQPVNVCLCYQCGKQLSAAARYRALDRIHARDSRLMAIIQAPNPMKPYARNWPARAQQDNPDLPPPYYKPVYP